jgi:hypothetical protein
VYFDRFDICEAWYLALSDAHGGQSSPEYERLSRLTRPGHFSPGPSLSVDSLSENGREIYWRACELLAGSYS